MKCEKMTGIEPFMKYRLSLAITMVLLMSGCSKIPYVVFFNNSGRALTINSEEWTYQVKAGAVIEIRYPGNTQMLKIDSGPSNAWRYKVEYPDKAHRWGNKFYVQIETDGTIYLLPPNTQILAKQLLPQPPGFPWRPTQ
jgi:hypothetical protein